MSEPQRILVTAFCQTPGLASVLKLLFPQAKIHSHAGIKKSEVDNTALEQLFSVIDVWINV
ncbi:MAG: hypothetical protein RLN70_08550, partial [Rhodospirillaceae bacterium]